MLTARASRTASPPSTVTASATLTFLPNPLLIQSSSSFFSSEKTGNGRADLGVGAEFPEIGLESEEGRLERRLGGRRERACERRRARRGDGIALG